MSPWFRRLFVAFCLIWLPLDVMHHANSDEELPDEILKVESQEFQKQLSLVRNDHAARMISNQITSHFYFMKCHYVLNIVSHICVSGGVLVSAAAGFWKSPILAFAASAWGVLGIALRNLSDFSKKESLRNLSLASHYLEREGVKGFDVEGERVLFDEDKKRKKNKE